MFRSLILMAAVMTTAPSLAQTEKTPVAGTRIGLDVPDGFIKADRFPGFVSETTGASIMVIEPPGSFAEVEAGFTSEGFAKQGMKLLKKEEVTFGDHKGLLFSAEQRVQGSVYRKWLGASGDEGTTFLIIATWPSGEEDSLSSVLRRTVLSARIVDAAADSEAALNFAVVPTGKFKIAKVIGNSMVLTEGGEFPVSKAGSPVMLIGSSGIREIDGKDRMALATERISRTANFSPTSIGTPQAVEIDGLSGYEIISEGAQQKTMARIFVYQAMLFEKGGYYLLQGIAGIDEKAEYLPAFKEMAASFRRKPSAK